jgi:hypothetical protein
LLRACDNSPKNNQINNSAAAPSGLAMYKSHAEFVYLSRVGAKDDDQNKYSDDDSKYL